MFEGEGKVQDYVGGYEDWLRQRAAAPLEFKARSPREPGARSQEPGARHQEPGTAKKLSYREQRELESLPARIESLEAEQRALNAKIADPAFYSEPGSVISDAVARLEALETELTQVYERWDSLESRS